MLKGAFRRKCPGDQCCRGGAWMQGRLTGDFCQPADAVWGRRGGAGVGVPAEEAGAGVADRFVFSAVFNFFEAP